MVLAVPESLDWSKASATELVVVALGLTVLLLVVAYGTAWLWHRFRDERTKG